MVRQAEDKNGIACGAFYLSAGEYAGYSFSTPGGKAVAKSGDTHIPRMDGGRSHPER
ncbi:MAG: hypothetical protein GY731_03755 [Gammaproteobacteria bacterium]|nr:hypothetical protein [Gammaproteobacteria bacterium]